jgi:hypothetical protein
MYLRYLKDYKKDGTPVYAWYEITETSSIDENFSMGKCVRLGRSTINVYALYHRETLQAICIGMKRDMKKLAKEMMSYTFDGVDTWKRGNSTIRSLTKLVESMS